MVNETTEQPDSEMGFDDCMKDGGKMSMKMVGGKMMKVCMLNGKSYSKAVPPRKFGPPTQGAFKRAASK